MSKRPRNSASEPTSWTLWAIRPRPSARALPSVGARPRALFAPMHSRITSIDIAQPRVMAAYDRRHAAFLFSSMAMGAVGRAAMDMIKEVRRQFSNIPESKPRWPSCEPTMARISRTGRSRSPHLDAADGKAVWSLRGHFDASIREMVVPGLLAVLAPVVIGGGGRRCWAACWRA